MIVRAQNISKTYFTEELETHALREISLDIQRGEYVAIEGPSGCGKSTLLSVLGLLEPQTSGVYELDGCSVSGLDAAARAAIRNRSIGFIFQQFNLIGDLTVFQNVELPLIYRGMTKPERHSRVEDVLQLVRLAARSKHYPSQLSGGEQQRVAVARALAGNPPLLLADEPTGNLDTRNGEAVMELLAELHSQGSTIVIVTHDPRFARCASRTIGLLDGAIVDAQIAGAH